MKLALVASAHGFGHLTRQLALAERLVDRGAEVTVFHAAPPGLVEAALPGVTSRAWVVDVGLAQRDSLHEDLQQTRRRLAERCSDAAIDALAEQLRPFDRVVADTAPTVVEACRRIQQDVVLVGNFDWAWIYGRYPSLADWGRRLAAWQAPARGLSLWPGPGLRGLRAVEQFGLVGRRLPAHRVAERAALVSFGGLGLDAIDRLLPRIDGLTWVLAPPMAPLDRPDCIQVSDVAYPALVAGCDLVFTKPGYGIFAECSLAGTKLVWAPRGAFPEAPFIEAAMAARGDRPLPVGTQQPDAFRAALAEIARLRLADPPPPMGFPDDNAAVAAALLADTRVARQCSTR